MEQLKHRRVAITISGLTLIVLGIAFSYYSKYLIDSSTRRQQVIASSIESIFEHEEDLLANIDKFSWAFLKGELDNAIQKSNIIGDTQVAKIEKDLIALGNLAYHFANFNDNDNPIVAILDKHTRGVYFVLSNDANDPFIMLVTLEGDIVIAIDTSGNCAIVDEEGKVALTRTLDEELKNQANPELADTHLTRIANHDKWSLDKPFYFQFTGKERVLPLEGKEFDLMAIENLFMQSKGNYSYVFRDIEFLVPSYLHDDEDILGTRRVSPRGVFNKDTKIIIYVMAFNFLDYINTHPRMQQELTELRANKDSIRDSTKLRLQKREAELDTELESVRVYYLARVLLNCLIIISCLSIFAVLRQD